MIKHLDDSKRSAKLKMINFYLWS